MTDSRSFDPRDPSAEPSDISYDDAERISNIYVALFYILYKLSKNDIYYDHELVLQ